MTFSESSRSVAAPEDEVEIVDGTGIGEGPGDFDAVVLADAVRAHLAAAGADADDEVVGHRLAHRRHDLQAEAHAALEVAAPAVGAGVGDGREELVDQVAVGEDLAAVQAALVAPPRRRGVGGDDPLDVLVLHGAGIAAVLGFAQARGADRGDPVVGMPDGAPAHVGDLADQRGAVPVDALRKRLEVGDDGIVADVDLAAEDGGRIGCDVAGTAEHRQRQAALCLFLVVELVAQVRLAVLGITRRMGGAHDAVLERQPLQAEGLQQGIVHAGQPLLQAWSIAAAISGPCGVTFEGQTPASAPSGPTRILWKFHFGAAASPAWATTHR